MNRVVRFERLWLISDRDRAARKIDFKKSVTVFLGANGTGKSRLTKHLMWVFGAEPVKRTAPPWDPDVVAALEFTYGDRSCMALRRNKLLSLFVDGRLVHAASNMRAWTEFASPFFGFKLRLKRPHSEHAALAGMEYLTIPSYIDQEGSWGEDWHPYDNLTQFDWKKAFFAAYVGERPNAYFDAKQAKDELHKSLEDKRREHKAQQSAFERVNKVLPPALPTLNISAFRAELAELGRTNLKIQQRQAKARAKLIAAVNDKQRITSELHLAQSAYRELVGDLSYLTELTTAEIECPTCGTRHQNSFHARLELSQDASTMSSLVTELEKRLQTADEAVSKVRAELDALEHELAKAQAVSKERKASLKFGDVLASASKKTLDEAFHRVSRDLSAEIRKLELKVDEQNEKLKRLDEPERRAAVLKYYEDQYASLASVLNVPAAAQVKTPRPGARSQAGGSEGKRSILAIHMALMNTNREYGDSPIFPFVVDTPQQSGQDANNLGLMIQRIGDFGRQGYQVILATEDMPTQVNIEAFQIVEMNQPNGALLAEQFEEALAFVRDPLRDAHDAVIRKVEPQREAAD